MRLALAWAVAFHVAAPAVGAQVVDLAGLDAGGASLFRALGSSGEGRFGVPVAGGFDCDSDGHNDLAVAAMRASPLGRSFAGEVFLIFGDSTLNGAVDTALPDASVLVIEGDGVREVTGSEVWMDDVTGDGVGDLLVARQNYQPNAARPGAGALTILVGGPELAALAATLQPLDLRAPAPGITATTLVGAGALERFGIWMRTGDVTGDTIADLVIGADQRSANGETHRGAAYVVRGGAHLASGGTIDLAEFGATSIAGHVARIDPPSGSDHFHLGATCQIADLDANGTAEVLVAATLNRAGAGLLADGQPAGSAHATGGAPHGRLYIAWDDNFSGNPWPAGFAFDLANAPGTTSTLSGGLRSRHFGEEIVGGLDWDGDGLPDLFVGDIDGDASAAQNRPASGSGHVFYAAVQLAGLSFDLDTPPQGLETTTLIGPSSGAISGDTATLGDFDGDGFADLAVASPHTSPLGRSNAGTVHVLHGQPGRWPEVVDLAGPLPIPPAARIGTLLGAQGSAPGDVGDTLAYSAAAGFVDDDASLDLITNEMLGNGSDPTAIDVGNLIVVSGALFAPEPASAPALLAALAAMGWLARWRHGPGAARSICGCAPRVYGSARVDPCSGVYDFLRQGGARR